MAKEQDRAPPSTEDSRASMPAGAVFLSYASQDADVAEQIAMALRTAGIEVWFDKSELRGGDAWDRQIRKQIRDCTLFIPIISAQSQARLEGYFRREWKLAADRTHDMAEEKAFLVPLVIDDTSERYACVPDRFREVQWTRMSAGETPTAFIERVQRLLSGEGSITIRPPAVSGAGVWSEAPPEKSLAVMPFANLSRDPENEYFSDGLAEEILNALSGVADLRVAARSSSFYFKGRTTDLQDIAKRLRVAHIVEGSVRRLANRVRVTAQLVDVRNGFQLWSERYDREIADVFEIQDEIAQAIARRLKVALLTGARRPTANIEAYELYLQGRHELQQRSPGATRAAVQYFERCIALDPDYALAHAGLVGCYGNLPFTGPMSMAVAHARAEVAMKRAMELAPGLWECNYARALYSLYFEGDWGESGRYFTRALEINPRDPMLNAHYAALQAVLRREAKAVDYVEAACKLDPLAPIAHAMGSLALGILGKFEEAEALARRALELQPAHYLALWRHGCALSGLGRHEEAIATMERSCSLWPAPIMIGLLGLVFGRAGRHENAGRLLHKLEESAARGEVGIGIGRLALELGSNDPERVRTAFTAALADGNGAYHIKIVCSPFIQPYRSDPEIDAIHRKLYSW
jgi:TolB-like protein/Flp pilus assembly protein TadD